MALKPLTQQAGKLALVFSSNDERAQSYRLYQQQDEAWEEAVTGKGSCPRSSGDVLREGARDGKTPQFALSPFVYR